jgi:molecular chaperone DnaK (HSP70)
LLHNFNQVSAPNGFSTAEDNQTVVTIRVFQGGRDLAADNRFLELSQWHPQYPSLMCNIGVAGLS